MTNSGRGPATSVPVRLTVDGDVVDTVTLAAIAPGEQHTVAIRGPDCQRLATLEVDPEQAIAESSDADNVVRAELRIPQEHRLAADTMGVVSATSDRPREAVKDAPIGGQAVLEGVMMRGISTWAVAVRKPTRRAAGRGRARARRRERRARSR